MTSLHAHQKRLETIASGERAAVREHDEDGAALARCVGDVEHFAAHVWGQRAWVTRCRGCFTDLLDTEAVEQMLRSAARRPSFRLVRDAVTLPPSTYTRSVRIGGTEIDDAADLERITALTASGATIVLQGLHRLWPPLQVFCAQLERAMDHPVQANAYLTPPGAAGLRAHRDTHEVLALQVEGTKQWTVDGLGDVTLEPGDVLYLPAGTQHAAAAQARHSLHLTIGVLARTYDQVLHRVLAGDARLRRPLPLGWARANAEAPACSEAALDVARRVGAEVLLTTGPAAVLAADGDRLRRARATSGPPPGTLRAVVDPEAVSDRTRLCRPRGLALRIEEVDGAVVLEGAGRRLRVPTHLGPALDLVARCPELSVGELPGLDGPSRAVLARRLVREGFLEIVPV